MNGTTINTPRYRVTMNGQVLDGVEHISVSLPFCFRVGHFSVSKAFMPDDAFPAAWWAATASKTMLITIELSSDGVQFWQVMSGIVDNHQYDPIANSLHFAGRDLAAGMCDARIFSTYRNLTASEIAGELAAEHGLQASITRTTTLAGRYYDIDHDDIRCGIFARASSEWDVLCSLGSLEGITPYVSGSILYFNPMPSNPPVLPVAFNFDASGSPISDVIGIQLERQMTLARDVLVSVRSWHSRSKQTFSAAIRSKALAQNASSDAAVVRYLVVEPNLSQAQCLTKARQLALDYARHERNVSVTLPSLIPATPQTVLAISGTGTDYDMSYYPEAIVYSVSFHGGASTCVQAKFSSDSYLYDDDTGEQID